MKDEEKKIIYCKNCKNGGEIRNFTVKCTLTGWWRHSPQECKEYEFEPTKTLNNGKESTTPSTDHSF